MSHLAIAYDSASDSPETQLLERERAFTAQVQMLAKRVAQRPEVAALFAGVDKARQTALAAREEALVHGQMALRVMERRLKELDQEHKQALALVRAQAPRTTLEAEIDSDEDLQLFTGFTRDLAQGGVFVPTVEALELGTQVDLQLRLPERTLRLQGEVRWMRECGQAGLGIAFQTVAANDLAFFTALETEPLFYPD